MAPFGYAGRILRVDLSSHAAMDLPIAQYTDHYVGGRGFGVRLYWDEVPTECRASDPENRLIFTTGPLAGVPVIGGSRWQVCGKSPASTPNQFSYCNLGGRWGADLKFAGYDGIVVQGRSDKPSYILVRGDRVEIRDASALWGLGAIETRRSLKSELGRSARVVAIGPAGENQCAMASLLADNDASGSGGLGAVMGSKRLKAVAVLGANVKVEIAQPERVQTLTRYYRELQRIPIPASSYRLSKTLTPSLRDRMKRDPCYGCGGCFRSTYESNSGEKGKYMCHSALFYQPWVARYYGSWNDVAFHATKLVDSFGLDSKVIDRMISWLGMCYEAGILNDGNTGIPISRIGSSEFIETLVRKISFRDGFGDILSGGLEAAAAAVGCGSEELLAAVGYIGKPEYKDVYGPRLYITHAIFYAVEPRLPMQQLHEIGTLIPKWLLWVNGREGAVVSSDVVRSIAAKFWGSEIAADFSTYEGKALAASKIQDRQYAKECLILCDYLWPITELGTPGSHVGDPTLESKLLSAVTGCERSEVDLYRIGERVFNLQRATLVMEGHRGKDFDVIPGHCHTEPLQYDQLNPECLVPGKEGQVISRRGAIVNRTEFDLMRKEYYALRGWDTATGFQTQGTLDSLGLTDVAFTLEKRGLLGESTGRQPEATAKSTPGDDRVRSSRV